MSDSGSAVLRGRRVPEQAPVRELDQPVHRRPAERARVRVRPPAGAHFPEALVGLAPVPDDEVAEGDERLGGLAVESAAAPGELRGGVDHFAVDVELELVARSVPQAHRPRTAVSGPRLELPFAPGAPPVEVVEHAERGPRQAGRVQEPAHEGARLGGVPQAEERAGGQGGVAQPAIPVVPVEVAAGPLGQGAGRRGHDGAGRGEREQLQRERAAHHRVPPRPGVGRATRPLAPQKGGALRRRAAVGPERREHRGPLFAIGQREGPRLAAAQPEPRREAAARVRGQVAIGAQDEQALARAQAVAQDAAVAVGEAGPAAVRARVVAHLELHLAAQALDQPQELVLGAQVAGLVGAPDRHQVGEARGAEGAPKRRLQEVRLGAVAALDLRGTRRADGEGAAALQVQQRAEDCGGVEARPAEPIERAAARDEGGGPAIAEQGVVLDGRLHEREAGHARPASARQGASRASVHELRPSGQPAPAPAGSGSRARPGPEKARSPGGRTSGGRA